MALRAGPHTLAGPVAGLAEEGEQMCVLRRSGRPGWDADSQTFRGPFRAFRNKPHTRFPNFDRAFRATFRARFSGFAAFSRILRTACRSPQA
eukprot:2261035-Prymnesium_polylepis.1